MNFKVKLSLVCAVLMCGSAMAQHSDVEFGYEAGGIIFESDGPGIDAAGVFESEFEVFNMDGTKVAEDPGFASNFTEGDETFSVTAGDSVFVNVNQSPTLGSFLTYFDPVSNQFTSSAATFTITDNSPMFTTDLVIDENGLVSGDTSQFIITSTGAEIDSHVDFTLSSGAADGAYGLLLSIESDNASGDLNDVTSDTYWVVFNNGLLEEDFERAVARFSGVPEPSAFGIVSVLALAALRRKRA